MADSFNLPNDLTDNPVLRRFLSDMLQRLEKLEKSNEDKEKRIKELEDAP